MSASRSVVGVGFQIWQRDHVTDVLRIPELVASGFKNDRAIAAQFGTGEDNRQGRYLIHAADIMGLIARPARCRIVVSGLGKTLMGAPTAMRKKLIRRIIVDTPAAREMLKLLGRKPMTASEVESYLEKHGLATDRNGKPYSVDTLKRRVRPFLNTLVSIGVAANRKNFYSRTALGTSMLRIRPKTTRPTASARKAKGAIKKVNVARRKSIEVVAADVVENYYTAIQGYKITRRYADNCGYDIEVHDPLISEPLCVEIKGTAVAKS